MNKKIEWVNKKCDWCLKNWWDGSEYITRACSFHKEYDYKHCLKQLKSDKKNLAEWRMHAFLIVLGCFFILGIGIWEIETSKLIGWITIVIAIIGFVVVGYVSIGFEKDYREWIKEDKKTKAEWEILSPKKSKNGK